MNAINCILSIPEPKDYFSTHTDEKAQMHTDRTCKQLKNN